MNHMYSVVLYTEVNCSAQSLSMHTTWQHCSGCRVEGKDLKILRLVSYLAYNVRQTRCTGNDPC